MNPINPFYRNSKYSRLHSFLLATKYNILSHKNIFAEIDLALHIATELTDFLKKDATQRYKLTCKKRQKY